MSENRDDAPTPLHALRDACPSPSIEQRIVDGAMGRALAPRRRMLVPVLIGAAAAAAGAWFALRPAPTPASVPDQPGVVAPISVAATTDAPPAQVRHQMTHGAGAVFEVQRPSDDRTEVQLTAGEARFEVEPLPPGGVFAVQTPHARVEVVGTQFSVRVAGGCSHVAVTEGRVRVRQGDAHRFVSAGEAYRACPWTVAGERWVQHGITLLVRGRATEGVAELERYVRVHPRGALVEEAMFQLALAADRAGDAAAIEQTVTRYLERFPDSARAGRIRALKQP